MNAEQQTEQVEPNFQIVALDETEYWKDALNREAPEIDKIFGVYLVDLNQVTYCCEITPSYYLHRITTEHTLKDILDYPINISPERAEELNDWVQNGAQYDEAGQYMHCRALTIATTGRGNTAAFPLSARDLRELKEGDITYDELVEDCIEVISCNSMYYGLLK